MYQIVLRKKARKNLNKLDKRYKIRITKAFIYLRNEPYSGKPLEGEFEGFYTFRVWPYRIIYKIYKNNLVIHIIDIGHRQGIYK